MGAYIDPITGAISYDGVVGNSSVGSPTSGSNKGLGTSTTAKNTQQNAQSTATTKVEEQIYEYCEGVVGVLPNPGYKAKTIYNIQGVGSIFNGNYYFRKVRHAIGADVYTVEADVCKMDNTSIREFSSGQSNRPQADAVPQPAPVAPAKPSYTMHKIVWGDTLWGLARKYYGNGALYNKIFEANRDTVKNPNLIYAGNWLKIPK